MIVGLLGKFEVIDMHTLVKMWLDDINHLTPYFGKLHIFYFPL